MVVIGRAAGVLGALTRALAVFGSCVSALDPAIRVITRWHDVVPGPELAIVEQTTYTQIQRTEGQVVFVLIQTMREAER